MPQAGLGSEPGLAKILSLIRLSARDDLFGLAPRQGLWQHHGMASTKKLTRADVHKQIDAFRGIAKQNPGDRPSVEQWAESKRAEKGLGARKFQRLAVVSRKS